MSFCFIPEWERIWLQNFCHQEGIKHIKTVSFFCVTDQDKCMMQYVLAEEFGPITTCAIKSFYTNNNNCFKLIHIMIYHFVHKNFWNTGASIIKWHPCNREQFKRGVFNHSTLSKKFFYSINSNLEPITKQQKPVANEHLHVFASWSLW